MRIPQALRIDATRYFRRRVTGSGIRNRVDHGILSEVEIGWRVGTMAWVAFPGFVGIS